MSAPVPSPCVSICRMDPATGWCEGCLRTLDEIGWWSVLDDEDKRAVWAQLEQRREPWRALKGVDAPFKPLPPVPPGAEG